MTTAGCGISTQQEIQIGREARPQFEQEFGGLYPDPRIQDYVQSVGQSLAARTDRPNLPWEFRVLNSDQVNAFALPGGFIYITRGLLTRLENEAQLASILAHEAAHVAHRHSVRQLERAQLLRGGAALAGLLGGETSPLIGDVSSVVAGLALMKYGRDQEKRADLSGLDYLKRQGYAPQAALNVMQVLESASGGRAPPEFLSSHPSPANRQEYLARRIRSRYADVISAGRTGREAFERNVLQSSAPVSRADAPSASMPARLAAAGPERGIHHGNPQ